MSARLSREQRRTWSLICGGIVVGSAVKVAYFNVSRNAFVDVAERRHKESLQNLKEAREWAEWSARDREKRLPKLTKEQEEQLNNYLKIVEQHGVNKAPLMSNGTEVCRNCPIFRNSSTVAMKQSARTS